MSPLPFTGKWITSPRGVLASSRGEFLLLKFITNCGLHKPTPVQNPNEPMDGMFTGAGGRSISLSRSELLAWARQAAFQGIHQSPRENNSLRHLLQAESDMHRQHQHTPFALFTPPTQTSKSNQCLSENVTESCL